MDNDLRTLVEIFCVASVISVSSGADFVTPKDRGHITANLTLFADEARNGKDSGLKAIAQKALPTIQHHHESAQKLAAL